GDAQNCFPLTRCFQTDAPDLASRQSTPTPPTLYTRPRYATGEAYPSVILAVFHTTSGVVPSGPGRNMYSSWPGTSTSPPSARPGDATDEGVMPACVQRTSPVSGS